MGDEEQDKQEKGSSGKPRKRRKRTKSAGGRTYAKDQFVVMERLESEEGHVDLRVVATGWTGEDGGETPFKDKADCQKWAGVNGEGSKRYRIAGLKAVDAGDGPVYEFGIEEEHTVARKIVK